MGREMRGFSRSARGAQAICVVLAVAIVAGTPGAFATPSTDAAIQQKEAERQAALAEVQRLQVELQRQITAYVDLGRRIEQTRVEVSDATSRVAQADMELARRKQVFRQRITQVYRTGGTNLIEVLFAARSLTDLIERFDYLSRVSEYDADLIEQMRLARQQLLFEQSQLLDRMTYLASLQEQADQGRLEIEAALEQQQARVEAIGEDIAELMRQRQAGEPRGDFDPDLVISETAFRDVTSMTEQDIQAFLDEQPGALKSYRGPNHAGVLMTAAQMIAEAAQVWNVSPRVILVTLQKEQSLLSRATPSQYALDWAMGCGKTDSSTLVEYQGFGKQIYFGARALDQNARLWSPGVQLSIDGNPVYPRNAATYSLYRYTPHLHGVTSFWLIHWRYFGDPLS